MGYKTSSIPTIKLIKAMRGEALTIDLGSVQLGLIEAWIKRDPNDPTYRSFVTTDNRKFTLTQDKTSDYLDQNSVVVEAIVGKWYFDIRQTLDVTKPQETKIIFKGEIFFSNNITGSSGVEVLDPIVGLMPYDNTISGLTATNIKSAIDELAALLLTI